MSVYQEIVRQDAAIPELLGGLPAEHSVTFTSPDETDLMRLQVQGALPLPAVGDVIELHRSEVVVTDLTTRYSRDGTTGRPLVHTAVAVRELDVP
ncbi:hypothetical protein [Kitasatospora sp. NPDC094015]|uniref:hypothetical protein n=1 Tax=Kitasatospora sp. NPDC094015 TaxID=3155205 RepID=UPI0033278CBE